MPGRWGNVTKLPRCNCQLHVHRQRGNADHQGPSTASTLRSADRFFQDPSQFDVVCTANMFGDILSDAASVIATMAAACECAVTGTARIPWIDALSFAWRLNLIVRPIL